jgi:hypothetical protein
VISNHAEFLQGGKQCCWRRAIMKRNSAPLFAYFAAITLGTVLFPAGAKAIPDYQIPSTGRSEPASDCRERKEAVIAEQNRSLHEIPVVLGYLPFGKSAYQMDLASEHQGDVGRGHTSCIDSVDISQRLLVGFGRRIGTSNDILSQFDGIHMNYRVSKGLMLNGIAGYPAVSEEDIFNSTSTLFGISASTKRFYKAWDLNGFILEQQKTGDKDGEYLGGAVRYLQPRQSLLLYLDYDVAENSLGASTASGAWRLPFKTTISTTLDRRNRPIPTWQDGYLKQSMSALKGWNSALPADRLSFYTRDGGREVSTVVLGLSHALSNRFQLSGDMAMLTSEADVNADTAFANLSREYIYHSKLTGRGLLFPSGRSSFDLRYNVTQTGRISTAALGTKYGINRYWKIAPKLRSDYHSAVPENAPRWVMSPTVKMEYRKNRQSKLQIEAGGEWATHTNTLADDSQSSYFVSLGYQAKF